jgi:hypothetical protein
MRIGLRLGAESFVLDDAPDKAGYPLTTMNWQQEQASLPTQSDQQAVFG